MLQVQHWESPLLDLAHQALEGNVYPLVHFEREYFCPEVRFRNEAYQQCLEITRESSKTFFMASNLLPDGKRRAAQALYAFCRVSDDIVDRPQGDVRARLGGWKQQVVYGANETGAHPLEREVNLAWTDARCAYQIPTGYMEQLIDGLAMDFERVRYDNFAELARYCYGVACTVGLMSMHIVGYSSREAIPYAIRLGVALQLTNILRDVGEDWRAGRLYLPRDEMAAFGLSEADIERGMVDERWREFMRFQIARARRLYDEALPGVALLHPDGRFAIAAAGELYSAILVRIEQNDYDVFRQRASVGAWGKLRRLPGIWLRASFARGKISNCV